MIELITSYPLWFLLLCPLVGAVYAWLLYRKQSLWGVWGRRVLFLLRFIFISFILFLIAEPLLKHIKNTREKPTVIIAVDNSESLTFRTSAEALDQTKNTLQDLSEKLKERGFLVEIRSLGETKKHSNFADIKFDAPVTDLAELLDRIESDYENRHLSGTILVSDGIINKGISPAFRNYRHAVHTVGAGDTVAVRDHNLKNIYYNRLVYVGNKFPLSAEIKSTGYKGTTAEVVLKQNGRVLDQKAIDITENDAFNTVEFSITAVKKGLQRFETEIRPATGEFTLANNTATAWVEAVEGKEKILLAAAAPHPNIKAIRSVIEEKQSVDLTVHIVGQSPLPNEKYDLVILHGLPHKSGLGSNLIKNYSGGSVSVWYILTQDSDYQLFNTINNVLRIEPQRAAADLVTGSYNKNFEKFSPDATALDALNDLPPISVPYARYSLAASSSVLLYQQVGAAVTDRPLLAVSDISGVKKAVMVGSDLWKWRLHEYAQNGDHRVTDELIGKLVRYLTLREDKRKFRVFPSENEFPFGERVTLEAEVYNDLFEKIAGQKIDLTVTTESGKKTAYSLITGSGNSRFEITGLPEGIHSFSASTKVDGKLLRTSGEFLIRKLQREALELTADHAVLRKLSENSGGKFVLPDQISELAEIPALKAPQDRIHSDEAFTELLNLPWLLVLLIILAASEWFIRKYKGGY